MGSWESGSRISGSLRAWSHPPAWSPTRYPIPSENRGHCQRNPPISQCRPGMFSGFLGWAVSAPWSLRVCWDLGEGVEAWAAGLGGPSKERTSQLQHPLIPSPPPISLHPHNTQKQNQLACRPQGSRKVKTQNPPLPNWPSFFLLTNLLHGWGSGRGARRGVSEGVYVTGRSGLLLWPLQEGGPPILPSGSSQSWGRSL